MISFFVIIVGFLVVIRTFQQTISLFKLSRREMNNYFAIFFLILSLQSFIFVSLPFVLWSSFGIIQISLILIQKKITKIKNFLFQKRILNIVDSIYFSAKSGQTLLSALQELAIGSPSWQGAILSEVIQKIQTKSHSIHGVKPNAIEDFTVMMLFLSEKKFGLIQSLKQYKSALKTQENFRRRSRRVFSQVFAQSFVLAVLFVMVFIFNLNQFKWQEMRGVSVIAVTFFVAGLVMIFKIGRNVRWKM